MIVTADLHLKEDSENIVFDEVFPGLVQAALEQMDRRIAILGDLWHLRYRVSVRLQNRLLDFLDTAPVEFVLLPGNHDQISPAGEHALEVFRELDNVEVKSEPGWDHLGLWIPYRKDPEDIRKALALVQPPLCPPIGWMHHGIRGAWMNDNIRDTEGLPTEYFAKLKAVYCGHYHRAQLMDSSRIVYVGSPYQTRADESGQQKSYIVWDPANMVRTFVNVDWGRKFHRLEVTADSPLAMGEAAPRDEIRIQTGPGVNPEELGKVVAAQGFNNVVITPVQKAAETRLQVDPSKGLPAYVQEYVKQFAGDLDHQRLLALFREITA